MAKDPGEMAVPYKHGKRQSKSWSFSRPNLEHKPLTQDQIRETSMKYLTREQKQHFELNSSVNKSGSLFGPKRDEPREKTPPQVNSEASITDDKYLSKLSVASSGMNDINALSMASFANTEQFPMTNASMRGSDVDEDMKLLESILTSTVNTQKMLSVKMNSKSAMSLVSLEPQKRTLDLDKSAPFRIDDWFQMEQRGEYLGKRKHFLRVINTMDYDEKVVQMSNYQLVHELVDFYAKYYNSNAHNYVWKDIWGNTLQMYKSLGENGLMDNSLIIDELGLDHFPTILLYFKDGFHDQPPMRLDISKTEPDGIKVPCRNY